MIWLEGMQKETLEVREATVQELLEFASKIPEEERNDVLRAYFAMMGIW